MAEIPEVGGEGLGPWLISAYATVGTDRAKSVTTKPFVCPVPEYKGCCVKLVFSVLVSLAHSPLAGGVSRPVPFVVSQLTREAPPVSVSPIVPS